MEENTFAQWKTDYSRRFTSNSVILFFVLGLALASFVPIFIIFKSTNIILLVIPILLILFFISLLPAYLGCFSVFKPEQSIRLTNLAVYFTNLTEKSAEKFLPWEKIRQYDIKNFGGKGIGDKIFAKPTRFYLKGVYDEDSLVIDAFGEDAETLVALFKEHNVPFGFMLK